MIPQVQDDLKQDFVFTRLSSRTFRMNHDTKTITGTIDEVKAVEQAIFLILHVERYRWLIYSWNYGVEFEDMIGKPVDYCIPEIEHRIKEALLQDDRITAVEFLPLRFFCNIAFLCHPFPGIRFFYYTIEFFSFHY